MLPLGRSIRLLFGLFFGAVLLKGAVNSAIEHEWLDASILIVLAAFGLFIALRALRVGG